MTNEHKNRIANFGTVDELLYIVLITNGVVPHLTYAANPVLFIAWFLIIPLWQESHFYLAHKILPKGWMMRNVHRIHHLNPNPGHGPVCQCIPLNMYYTSVAC